MGIRIVLVVIVKEQDCRSTLPYSWIVTYYSLQLIWNESARSIRLLLLPYQIVRASVHIVETRVPLVFVFGWKFRLIFSVTRSKYYLFFVAIFSLGTSPFAHKKKQRPHEPLWNISIEWVRCEIVDRDSSELFDNIETGD